MQVVLPEISTLQVADDLKLVYAPHDVVEAVGLQIAVRYFRTSM